MSMNLYFFGNKEPPLLCLLGEGGQGCWDRIFFLPFLKGDLTKHPKGLKNSSYPAHSPKTQTHTNKDCQDPIVKAFLSDTLTPCNSVRWLDKLSDGQRPYNELSIPTVSPNTHFFASPYFNLYICLQKNKSSLRDKRQAMGEGERLNIQ